MPNISFKDSTEISLMLLSQQDDGLITSVDEYIPPKKFLLKKLAKHIQSLITMCIGEKNNASNTALIQDLNRACFQNKHFVNISYLLYNFHEHSDTVKLETAPPFYLIPCSQKTNSSPLEHVCSTFILSTKKLYQQPHLQYVFICQKKFKSKRKEKR